LRAVGSYCAPAIEHGTTHPSTSKQETRNKKQAKAKAKAQKCKKSKAIQTQTRATQSTFPPAFVA
jgi:hypothetical protein